MCPYSTQEGSIDRRYSSLAYRQLFGSEGNNNQNVGSIMKPVQGWRAKLDKCANDNITS